MERLIHVGIKDIIKYNPSLLLSYKDDIAIVDFVQERTTSMKDDIKLRINAMSLIIITNGEIKININGRNYHFNSRVLFDIMELHTFGQMSISPDCQGYHIIISNDFIKDVMGVIRKRPSLSTFLERCENPVVELLAEEAELMEGFIQRLIRSIKREGHLMHNELVKNELRGLFIEALNIIMSKTTEKSSGSTTDNKDRIIIEFVFLLNNFCLKEHSVDFYANKLCVDAKYLSRVLKKQTGKTASTWIDEALLKEAKIHLGDHMQTIQQVADKLNFSDQSAFGKFFKKHCKVSPSDYRKQTSQS